MRVHFGELLTLKPTNGLTLSSTAHLAQFRVSTQSIKVNFIFLAVLEKGHFTAFRLTAIYKGF
jgi:hypothetical protein